jgi:hypothetical protein
MTTIAAERCRMQSKSDFWLTLHHLANDLEREGTSNEDRTRTLMEVLDHVSPSARIVYQENCLFVLRALNSLAVAFPGKDDGRPADNT